MGFETRQYRNPRVPNLVLWNLEPLFSGVPNLVLGTNFRVPKFGTRGVPNPEVGVRSTKIRRVQSSEYQNLVLLSLWGEDASEREGTRVASVKAGGERVGKCATRGQAGGQRHGHMELVLRRSELEASERENARLAKANEFSRLRVRRAGHSSRSGNSRALSQERRKGFVREAAEDSVRAPNNRMVGKEQSSL